MNLKHICNKCPTPIYPFRSVPIQVAIQQILRFPMKCRWGSSMITLQRNADNIVDINIYLLEIFLSLDVFAKIKPLDDKLFSV